MPLSSPFLSHPLLVHPISWLGCGHLYGWGWTLGASLLTIWEPAWWWVVLEEELARFNFVLLGGLMPVVTAS